MINKSLLSAAIFYCCTLICYSQNRNSVWIFGDSTGIDFSNITNPIPITTGNESRGTCASISDTSGQLLLYAYDPDIALWQSGGTSRLGVVKNKFHQIVKSGDSLIGDAWYHEMILLPMPGNDSLYYLFTVGVSVPSDYGLWYSIVDVKTDSVILKNVQLKNFPMVDCLTAVKHGNGRDWWLVFRRWFQTFQPTDAFFTYLISPAGITNFHTQHIGSIHYSGQGELDFSPTGNKLLNIDGVDLIELFDFDRCTGLLSNPVTIHPAELPGSQNYSGTWSAAFSPNGNVLYVSTSRDTNHLYQLDLTAASIYASRINLDTFYRPPVSPGALKLAPDGKIYFSCAYDNGVQFNYPYADSMYNNVNMYLGVINNPDNLGTACNYTPFSFHLGGKRTYYGLPNNPDYELGALTGSICDTLTSVQEIISNSEAELFVFYHNGWQTLFVNAQHIIGKNCLLQIFDMNGKEVFSSLKQTQPPYFTQDVNCAAFAKGMYVVVLQTEKERLVKKFVRE
jgi:type IX secretion system substrate protein